MFDEGQRRKSGGQDAVVGGIQLKGSEDLAGKLCAFEVIPALDTRAEVKSLDVPAILRRNPGACLVDELAYDNPPGAHCPRRWQEVEQLVDAGIK